MKRVKILISGNVTGVFFRRFVRVNAEKLDLKGYVRNIDDKVEAVFEGDNKQIDKIIELCKQGPSGSKVDNVDVKEEEYKGEFDSFEQR